MIFFFIENHQGDIWVMYSNEDQEMMFLCHSFVKKLLKNMKKLPSSFFTSHGYAISLYNAKDKDKLYQVNTLRKLVR